VRAVKSATPPAPKGTTNRIDLLGKACATATWGKAVAAKRASKLKRWRRVIMVFIRLKEKECRLSPYYG
jgi:hypothetical protein